jgi:hypothetical protein
LQTLDFDSLVNEDDGIREYGTLEGIGFKEKSMIARDNDFVVVTQLSEPLTKVQDRRPAL